MSYVRFCKQHGVLDREDTISGTVCNGCDEFTPESEDSCLTSLPPGWLSIDIANEDRDGKDGYEYIPKQDYCPPCALTIRRQLYDYPLPWSRSDPSNPSLKASEGDG